MPVSYLLRVLLWLWFGAALAAGHYLLLRRIPGVITPVLPLAIAALLLVALFRVSLLRRWMDSIDLRALVLLHTTRFIGIYVFTLYQRGELPRAFAMPSGITDIVVATMAIPVALAPLDDALRRRAMVIWNTVGTVGILLATFSAVQISLAQPLALRELTRLPLSLVPTFLTPLLLVTHVILFHRTRPPAGV